MRIRMIGNTTVSTTTATCGHEVKVVVAPHDLRNGPGPVGRKKIAEAQANDCRDCQYQDFKAGKPTVTKFY